MAPGRRLLPDGLQVSILDDSIELLLYEQTNVLGGSGAARDYSCVDDIVQNMAEGVTKFVAWPTGRPQPQKAFTA